MSEQHLHADPIFDVISASFFRKKQCVLPGIGRLELTEKPAQFDFPHHQMLAPRPSILFYPLPEAASMFNEFSAISQLLMEKLLRNGEVMVTGLGSFTYGNGIVDFSAAPFQESLLQPVQAVKVIHKDAVHSMLVGDRETTNTAMQELLSETVQEKSGWWKGAIILSALAIAALLYYLSSYGFNGLVSKTAF
jgi:hypothetical protein